MPFAAGKLPGKKIGRKRKRKEHGVGMDVTPARMRASTRRVSKAWVSESAIRFVFVYHQSCKSVGNPGGCESERKTGGMLLVAQTCSALGARKCSD